jgi:nucleoside phosphorylase
MSFPTCSISTFVFFISKPRTRGSDIEKYLSRCTIYSILTLYAMIHKDYTVGWICAVQTEYVVACELLDQEHPLLPKASLLDNNTYTLGSIGNHNIVIASLPKGKYGIASAATVAKDMLRSFESIRIGLLVGIGGGAPSDKHDIRLGDVVVGSPTGKTGGVIHYEFGKAIQDRKFEFTGSLNSPPTVFLTALTKLSALHERKGNRIAESVSMMIAKNQRLKGKYRNQGAGNDRLYESPYTHSDAGQKCEISCSSSSPPLIKRLERSLDQDDPVVHYGLIASADRVMENAMIRDNLTKEHDVLCFETEAAGLMDNFPCIVIRGICDYSDTHKNDMWQGFAAATAAVYAKELLLTMPGSEVIKDPPAVEIVG